MPTLRPYSAKIESMLWIRHSRPSVPTAPTPAVRNEESYVVVTPGNRESASAILARATAPVNPSAIKAAIVRREPDFDERDHGFSSFSRLLEHMEKDGLLRREQGAKGQWYVLPPA